MSTVFAFLRGLVKSKTVWYNSALIVAFAIDYMYENNLLGGDKDVIAITVAVGNLLLRFVTKKPLIEK